MVKDNLPGVNVEQKVAFDSEIHKDCYPYGSSDGKYCAENCVCVCHKAGHDRYKGQPDNTWFDTKQRKVE